MKATNEELREMVKAVAEGFELAAGGDGWRCPHCENVFGRDEAEERDWTCPHCGEDVGVDGAGSLDDADECEPCGVSDWLDDALNIEVRRAGIARDAEVRGVYVLCAFGGPNITLDTYAREVVGHWGIDTERFPVHSDACDELEQLIEEIA
ncbi:hypothetical protein [Adlercreutzia caecimuris]|uniref:hypothetical protein n=1 Tax=Adlercreutzia caecimuris TaxID=671266 RepID=UPI002589CD16|nr:hypothetical protein [Adlercreutzia caecimuris]